MERLIPFVTAQAMALLRFHLGAGGRLAQRVFLPVFGSFFLFYFFLGPEFFNTFMAALIGGGYFSSAIPTTIFVLIVAKMASRRMAHGITGWMRHLPIKESKNRQIILIALVIAILPLLSLLALLFVAAASQTNINIMPLLAGLPMVAMAAALFTLPMKRRYLSRPLLALACLCYSSQDWTLIPAGLLLHICGAIISGPMISTTKRTGFSATGMIHLILSWRAMRMRLLIPYLLSFMTFPFLILFLANNPFQHNEADMAIRLTIAVSLMVFCACFAHILASRRPPWLWSRSLPWSAWQRILWDALFLFMHLLPLLLCAVIIRWQMTGFIFCCLPGLIILSVMLSRRLSESRFGVFGQVLRETLLPVLLFALLPWISLLYLLLTPWLIHKIRLEEMALPVSAWRKVSHLADGDSLSWRGN